MLDTNIFNHVVDGLVDVSKLNRLKGKFFVTHIQHDELQNTKDEKRKSELLNFFSRIVNGEDTLLTESFILDVSRLDQAKLGSNFIPTESAVFGVSRWGQAKWTPEDNLYSILKTKLDQKKKKKNNIQDALIAETAIRNELILLTNDINLKDIVTELGGLATNI